MLHTKTDAMMHALC